MHRPQTISRIKELAAEGKTVEEIRILTLVPTSTIRRICGRVLPRDRAVSLCASAHGDSNPEMVSEATDRPIACDTVMT